MNDYDKELLKTCPSMFNGIAVQVDRVNGGHNISLSVKDVCGMAEFGLALGGQISEADNTNTGKVIAECAIGGALIGCFIGLLAANIANMVEQKKRMTYQNEPIQLPTSDNGGLETKMAELARLYHLR
jgi:hypothetical protein